MKLGLEHTYARDLPGTFARVDPERVSAPQLLFWNEELAGDLDLPLQGTPPARLADLFSGNDLPEDAYPVAQVYAGHQFGGFSPRLGDGRAHLLGEIASGRGGRRDLALKGSGRTPFSRGGDGKAAVGPMLREVLIGEFLHAMGVPTTRALAVVATGDVVQRETPLPGAILARVAASHIRVGTFEYFASRGEVDQIRRLADHAIARHDPHLVGAPDRYRDFLEAVARRQAGLIARWMGLGFIHGVMNTDNMAVSGESIDFGPCAFLESYHPDAVFSSIDHHGRYAFGNQPAIAQWNLARLGESLLPILHADESSAIAQATEIVNAFPGWFRGEFLEVGRGKLGFSTDSDPEVVAGDRRILEGWLAMLRKNRVDHTRAWRGLADAVEGDASDLTTLLGGAEEYPEWVGAWRGRLGKNPPVSGGNAPGSGDRTEMRRRNPLFIPRNHVLEEVLSAATDQGDLEPFHRLVEVLRSPWEDHPGCAPWATPADPETASLHRTFCGT